LYLNSLTDADEDFLKKTKINGWLKMYSLNPIDKEILNNNIKKLTIGYFPDQNYCFFDRILSHVISVKSINDYTVYLTPFEYIVQKDNFTAHAESIEKGIKDVEFKILSEQIKNQPLTKNTVLNLDKYRMITGACELGCKEWIKNNGLKEDAELRVSDLVPMLEKSGAYGLDRIKELIVD